MRHSCGSFQSFNTMKGRRLHAPHWTKAAADFPRSGSHPLEDLGKSFLSVIYVLLLLPGTVLPPLILSRLPCDVATLPVALGGRTCGCMICVEGLNTLPLSK